MKKFLSANEAVAHAAAQAGCVVASAYPGTPSTEILENIAKFKDTIKCEWAVNEKVAVETAVGASMAACRSIPAAASEAYAGRVTVGCRRLILTLRFIFV